MISKDLQKSVHPARLICILLIYLTGSKRNYDFAF